MPLTDLDAIIDERNPDLSHGVLRRTDEVILATILKARRDLGSASQLIRDDAAATGMNCAKYMGRIEGLEEARTLIAAVDEETTGRAKKREKA